MRTREPPPPGPKVAVSLAAAPAPPPGVPLLMIAVFCATLFGVLLIAAFDMLSPGRAPSAGERAPSWPAR